MSLRCDVIGGIVFPVAEILSTYGIVDKHRLLIRVCYNAKETHNRSATSIFSSTRMRNSIGFVVLCCFIVTSMAEDASNETEKEIMKGPCDDVDCNAGQECIVKDGRGECLCVEQCAEETDPRRKVCTNHNETWMSDCEVHRMRCLCDKSDDRCTDDKFRKVRINYYGQCKDIDDCTEDQFADFPRRMREWFFNVMDDLARRKTLEPNYEPMLEEAKNKNSEEKWINPSIWKFCDLDVHPTDRKVSRHELFPIRAPLLSMEHCVAPFLDKCDVDEDYHITLSEWGKCLELNEGDIADKCVRTN